jgi:hypothetical protein
VLRQHIKLLLISGVVELGPRYGCVRIVLYIGKYMSQKVFVTLRNKEQGFSTKHPSTFEMLIFLQGSNGKPFDCWSYSLGE